jgi:hypothetical protein
LILVSATYSEGAWVRLTLDRDISSPAGMNVAAVIVDDGDIGDRFRGTGTATLFGPRTVQVNVASIGPTTVLDTRLTAGGDSGITAAQDGATWGGVANVALPFS